LVGVVWCRDTAFLIKLIESQFVTIFIWHIF